MFRSRRKKQKVEEIDITSLLDILVILLVFLLKSFNDSDLSVEIANELALPYSLSRAAGSHGTILQVNKRQDVFVNSERLGNMLDPKTGPELIKVLNSEFKRRSDLNTKKTKKKGFIINFVFDKTLQYKEINEIMTLSSQTGFNKYKLIIQGEE